VDEGVQVSERTYILLICVTPKQILCPTTSYILLVRTSILLGGRCQVVYCSCVCSDAEFRNTHRLLFPTVHRNTWRYFCDHVRKNFYFYAIFPHKHMEITSMPHCLQEHLVITSIANSPPGFLIFNYVVYSTVSDHGTECVI